MTTIYNKKITCCLCNKESEYRGIGSTNAFGSPDLDTRPPQMQRSKRLRLSLKKIRTELQRILSEKY